MCTEADEDRCELRMMKIDVEDDEDGCELRLMKMDVNFG